MLDVLQTQRRYYVFDKNTFKHFLKLCDSLPSYKLEKPTKRKSTDIFYDNAKNILEETGLLLRKRVYGAKSKLKIKRRVDQKQYFYSDVLRSHEREKEIATRDPLSKHYFFLNNALNSMFTNTLQFDPDKLFDQMQVTLTIDIKETCYKMFGGGGLKAEIRDQKLKFVNYRTKRKSSCDLIQIVMLSDDNTLPYFEDFWKLVEKRCKEIFYTTDSRYEIGERMTKPLPTKEELKQLRIQRLREQEMNGGETKK